MSERLGRIFEGVFIYFATNPIRQKYKAYKSGRICKPYLIVFVIFGAVVELVETPPYFEAKASLLKRSRASLSGSFRHSST